MRYSKKNHKIYLKILKNKKLSEHTLYPDYAPADPVLKELFWGFTHFKDLNWDRLLKSRPKMLLIPDGFKITKADLNCYIRHRDQMKISNGTKAFPYLDRVLAIAKHTNKVGRSYYLDRLSKIVRDLYVEER